MMERFYTLTQEKFCLDKEPAIKIGEVLYADYYNRFLEIIKMLTGLIKSLDYVQNKRGGTI